MNYDIFLFINIIMSHLTQKYFTDLQCVYPFYELITQLWAGDISIIYIASSTTELFHDNLNKQLSKLPFYHQIEVQNLQRYLRKQKDAHQIILITDSENIESIRAKIQGVNDKQQGIKDKIKIWTIQQLEGNIQNLQQSGIKVFNERQRLISEMMLKIQTNRNHKNLSDVVKKLIESKKYGNKCFSRFQSRELKNKLLNYYAAQSLIDPNQQQHVQKGMHMIKKLLYTYPQQLCPSELQFIKEPTTTFDDIINRDKLIRPLIQFLNAVLLMEKGLQLPMLNNLSLFLQYFKQFAKPKEQIKTTQLNSQIPLPQEIAHHLNAIITQSQIASNQLISVNSFMIGYLGQKKPDKDEMDIAVMINQKDFACSELPIDHLYYFKDFIVFGPMNTFKIIEKKESKLVLQWTKSSLNITSPKEDQGQIIRTLINQMRSEIKKKKAQSFIKDTVYENQQKQRIYSQMLQLQYQHYRMRQNYFLRHFDFDLDRYHDGLTISKPQLNEFLETFYCVEELLHILIKIGVNVFQVAHLPQYQMKDQNSQDKYTAIMEKAKQYLEVSIYLAEYFQLKLPPQIYLDMAKIFFYFGQPNHSLRACKKSHECSKKHNRETLIQVELLESKISSDYGDGSLAIQKLKKLEQSIKQQDKQWLWMKQFYDIQSIKCEIIQDQICQLKLTKSNEMEIQELLRGQIFVLEEMLFILIKKRLPNRPITYHDTVVETSPNGFYLCLKIVNNIRQLNKYHRRDKAQEDRDKFLNNFIETSIKKQLQKKQSSTLIKLQYWRLVSQPLTPQKIQNYLNQICSYQCDDHVSIFISTILQIRFLLNYAQIMKKQKYYESALKFMEQSAEILQQFIEIYTSEYKCILNIKNMAIKIDPAILIREHLQQHQYYSLVGTTSLSQIQQQIKQISQMIEKNN